MKTITLVLAMAAMVVVLVMPAEAGTFLIDCGNTAATGWDSFNSSVGDTAITDTNGVDNDVTLSIGAIGGNGNVPGVAGGTAVDGISVPSQAWDDYIWGPGNGSEILFEFKNLDAGDYNVSIFLGRNNTQHGRVWVGTIGDDPGAGGSGDTGDFGFGSQTIALTVSAGQSLFYVHEEDNTGGTSGIIVRQTAAAPVPTPGTLIYGK